MNVNDIKITLTDAAKAHIAKAMERHPGCKAVRIGIQTMGCSGQAYKLDYVDSIDADSDRVFEDKGITLVTDEKSAAFFDQGLIIDYETQGLNAMIVFRNPKESGRCGCGESFTI